MEDFVPKSFSQSCKESIIIICKTTACRSFNYGSRPLMAFTYSAGHQPIKGLRDSAVNSCIEEAAAQSDAVTVREPENCPKSKITSFSRVEERLWVLARSGLSPAPHRSCREDQTFWGRWDILFSYPEKVLYRARYNRRLGYLKASGIQNMPWAVIAPCTAPSEEWYASRWGPKQPACWPVWCLKWMQPGMQLPRATPWVGLAGLVFIGKQR